MLMLMPCSECSVLDAQAYDRSVRETAQRPARSQYSSRGRSFSPSTQTSTFVAEIPLRTTRDISSRAPKFKAATVFSSSAGETPASTSAPMKHVAADPGKTLKVGNAHMENRRWPLVVRRQPTPGYAKKPERKARQFHPANDQRRTANDGTFIIGKRCILRQTSHPRPLC